MADSHHHNDRNEHPLGFPYWHFFDLGSDAMRSVMRPLNHMLERSIANPDMLGRAATRLLPATTHLLRVLPVVGVAGETVHVYTPFMHAQRDWREGHLSNERFGTLCAVYTAYVASGMGGLLTAGAKEGLTHLVQHSGLVEEAYIPHTLYAELQHAGLLPTRSDHSGQHHHHDAGKACSVCQGALSQLPAPATPAQPARTRQQHRH